jgi:hypothetical protein
VASDARHAAPTGGAAGRRVPLRGRTERGAAGKDGGGVFSLGSDAGLAAVWIAGLVGGFSFDLPIVTGLVAIGSTGTGLASLFLGQPAADMVVVAAIAVVGLGIGVSRRDAQRRLEQTATVRAEDAHMALERDRAQAVAHAHRTGSSA